MQNKKCLERCLELIRDKRYRELSAILAEQNPVDLADLLEGLPQEQARWPSARCPRSRRPRCSWSWILRSRRCSSRAFPTRS